MDEPVEVVEVWPAHAEGRSGSVACDPTYQTIEPAPPPVLTAPLRPPPVPTGPPPVPPKWGELNENPAPNRALLSAEFLFSGASEEPLLKDPFSEDAPIGKVPIEFDMVEAANIEVDLPTSPTAPTVSVPLPSSALPPGPSVFVEGRFYERLPLAFVAPLLGKAWALLLFSALVPAFASLLLTLDVGVVLQVSFAVPVILFSIGLLTEVFSRLAQEGADNDEGLPAPTLGDTDLQTVLGSGMATVVIAALLFVLPAYLFLWQYIGVGMFTALSFLPFVYWPMALTVQGITGNIVAGLDMPLVFRSMLRAPLKYVVVVALGFGLTVALTLGSALVVSALVAAAGPSRTLMFGVTFVFFGTLTYLHGVMGYAMGRLVATEDKLARALVRR